MGEVVAFEQNVRCCAGCQIPLTTATAEGREDCFHCDKCLEAIIDGDLPIPQHTQG